MGFKHIPANTTELIPKGGVFAKITGKNDLIYTRNRWQQELDNSWAALMNMAHFLEDSQSYIQTVVRSDAIAAYRGQVDDEKKKNDKQYQEVFKCIEKDQAYQERMWKIHQEMHKNNSKSMNVSTSLDNINITKEEMKEYVQHYPTVQTSHDIKLIKDMEEKLCIRRNEFRQNVSSLRDYFEQFKLELNKLESKYTAYINVKVEGEKALSLCSYTGSFFNRFDSAETRQMMRIDCIHHRVEQVEGTIKHFEQVKAKVEQIISVEMDDYKKAIAPEFVFDTVM